MILYRAAAALAFPAALLAFLLRALRGRERLAEFRERLGGGGAGRPGAIWIHGASLGETASAEALVRAIRERFPSVPVVMTAHTPAGRARAAQWSGPGLEARLAPLDAAWTVSRFLRRWRPSAHVVLENELWPNRIDLAARAGAPVLCLSARLSRASARGWARWPGLARRVMSRIDHLAPQDEASRARFLELGLRPAALGPVLNLKSTVDPAPPDPAELARLGAFFERGDTVLAASTHPGEDEAALDALLRCRGGLRLILAPRHPRRAGEIRRMAEARGLAVARRSLGEAPGARVYLADTLGEMALWYSLAGATFVGGSLAEMGGHTPFEPAAFGSAVLHGPHVANFADAYRALDARGGAREVRDAASLAEAFEEASDPARRGAMAAAARAWAAEARRESGDYGPFLDILARAVSRGAGP